MKISDLARLPHQIRSVSWAASRPNAVESAGTTSSHRKLLRIASQNLGSPIILLVVREPDEGAARLRSVSDSQNVATTG